MYTNTDIAIGGLIQATSEYKYAMKVYVNFEETRAKVKELVESNKMLLSGDAFKTLEKGEKPRACALREIQEETGYKAKKLTRLITYYPSVGYNKEVIHCFVAKGLQKISGQMLDEDEIMSVVKIDMKKLLGMIKNGKIIDSKTICAVLTYAIKNKLH